MSGFGDIDIYMIKKERIGREKQIDIGIELVFKTQPLFMI